MGLSKRLQAVADFVAEGFVVADIGCDHGYIPIYLMEQGKARRAIAMDVNPGPLDRARKHIEAAGMEQDIRTVLSDGLTALRPGEAQVFILAGMGGRLMMRILSEGRRTAQAAACLVLQPQSEVFWLRRFLEAEGYLVQAEDMVEEDGKYYPIMRACPQRAASQVYYGQNEAEYLYGAHLLQERHPVLRAFLDKEQHSYEAIARSLQAQEGERAGARLLEVKERLSLIAEALGYYGQQEVT